MHTLDRKLDMSLDDLCDRRSGHTGGRGRGRDRDGGGSSRGHGREGSSYSRRDGPYESRRDGKDRNGKGNSKQGGKRRLPPEDKALLHTICFIKAPDELLVRLYETEVITLRKVTRTIEAAGKPAEEKKEAPAEGADAAAPKAEEGDKSENVEKTENGEASEKKDGEGEKTESKGAEGDSAEKAEGKVEDKDAKEDTSKAPEATPAPSTSSPPATSSTVVTASFNCGGFKTAETRYVINEVLRCLGSKVNVDEVSRDQGRWIVLGTQTGKDEVPFEDEMEVVVPDARVPFAVCKERMVNKIYESKDRLHSAAEEAYSNRDRDGYGYYGAPAPSYGYGHPAPYGHPRPPPHGYHAPPPSHGHPYGAPGYPPPHYGYGAPPPGPPPRYDRDREPHHRREHRDPYDRGPPPQHGGPPPGHGGHGMPDSLFQ